MNPIEDTLSRHGVLPATATSAPKRKPEPLTGPVWMLVKVGDTILVQGDGDVKDGSHVVRSVSSSINIDPEGAAISVGKNTVDTEIIYNHAVKQITRRDGKPFQASQADVDAFLKDRPIWELVRSGDRVEIAGLVNTDDGVYLVHSVDDDQFGGADLNGIRLDDEGYVLNKGVMRIVERDGKPYGDQPAVVAAPAVDPLLWTLVKKGDKIEVTPQQPGTMTGHWVNRAGGIFEVTEVDTRRPPVSDLDFQTHDGWIPKDRLVRIVSPAAVAAPAPAPAPVTPVSDLVKVGDTVRVKKGADHPAGEYVVTRAKTSGAMRLAVDYGGRNGKIWWIRNTHVEAIVTGKPAILPVRGEFLIHVDVPSIMSNRSNGEHKAVTVTRRLSDPTAAHLARELAWDGPTRFVHHEFMKIEGTDIQNWVETDVPVTCWRDTGLEVMTAKPDEVVNPMTKPILGGFVIHIAAPVLMKNRQEGRNDPVIAVRKAFTNWATDVVFARKVEWSGPTRMVHRPSTPIPGTNGRGVAFLETDADLTLYVDGQDPIVLRMPSRQAIAA
ncbi:hypothetical protein [Methylobacterium sp. WL120]|uniref:hypothetical protein n=1 Tax=Methylobacterium sp. WL120 TaxID=2603887 RepID=UPI0011CB3118|nr:hypothetical protein [Methylobacterium sp. WL120]TXM69652.1 hypothetical protein FV229_04725 [Methylobacterium sp. WL120]